MRRFKPSLAELQKATPENYKALFRQASDEDIASLAADGPLATMNRITQTRAIGERGRRDAETSRAADRKATLAILLSVLAIALTIPLVQRILGME